MLRSVVLLRSATRQYCASGVLLQSGNIITAAHVARELCSQDTCHNLVVGITESAGGTPNEHTGIPYRILTYLEALDLAVLAPPDDTAVRGAFALEKVTTPQATSDIILASYPGCRVLKLSKGKITDINELGFTTTASGSRGSSGGAVMTDDGQLVGVITRAVSEWDAFWGLLYGGTFHLKGQQLHADLLAGPPSQKSLLSQLKLFKSYWESNLITQKNPSLRKWLALDYLRAEKGFKESALRAQLLDTSPLLGLLALERHPGHFIDFIATRPEDEAPSALQKAIDAFVLTATLEKKGLRQTLNTGLDIAKATVTLEKLGRVELKDILLRFDKNPYQGADMMWLALSIWIAVPVVPLLALYCATIGFVWGKEQGWSKLKFTLMVALLGWPFSLIAYYLRLRRLKKSALS